MNVSFVSWLCISGPLPGFALQYPRLNPSAIGIAGIEDASSPTGEVTDASSDFGGWKPMTAYSLRLHSGNGLSGSPPSEPLRRRNRATRFIISSRDQVRISFHVLMRSSV